MNDQDNYDSQSWGQQEQDEANQRLELNKREGEKDVSESNKTTI